MEKFTYEKRVEDLRHDMPPRKSSFEINHSEIFEIDDQYFHDYSDAEQGHGTQQNATPINKNLVNIPKNVPGFDTPPARVSSLLGSAMHGNSPRTGMSSKSKPKLRIPVPTGTPPAVPKALKTPILGGGEDELLVSKEPEKTQQEDRDRKETQDAGPMATFIKGSTGFSLLAIFLFLLLLNLIGLLTLRLLYIAKFKIYTMLFSLLCLCLQQSYLVKWVCVPTVVGLILAIYAGGMVVLVVIGLVGIWLVVAWWLWCLGMLGLERSEGLVDELLEHWMDIG